MRGGVRIGKEDFHDVTAIVLAADDRYLPFVPCSLRQLATHAPTADGVVLAVPAGTSPVLTTPAERAARRFGMSFEVVALDSLADLERRGAIAERGHVSTFTYSKLAMAHDLTSFDEVLYLDVDTLVRGSLAGLLDWPLRYEIGGVPELGTNGLELFSSIRVPYFNAGVLRMSLARMRESGLWERSQDVLREHPRLPFQDQDVLNLLYRDAFDVLPPTYNVFDLAVREASLYFQVFHDPTIVHFVGPTKPWHREAGSANARAWRRLNAEALQMQPEQARRYLNGGRPDSRHRVSAAIAAARFSPVGRRVRALLPYEVKHAVNQAVLKVVPPRTRLAEEVFTGIVASGSPRGGIAPPPSAPPRSALSALVARPTRTVVPTGEAPTRPVTGSPRPSASVSRPDLLLVLSTARSGTNALGSMLTTGFPRATWCGEAYSGVFPPAMMGRLAGEFPWAEDAQSADFKTRMDENVLEVTRSLIDLSDNAAIIKVFPRHLSREALDSVLREMSPRVVVLRRTLMFTLLSLLKSRTSGIWYGTEQTDVEVEIDDRQVADYVARMDDWFDWVDDRIHAHGLDALQLTYSELYETREGLDRLRAFPQGWSVSPTGADNETWLPRSSIQDRRTDESLTRALLQLTALSPDNQRALLRLPGRGPADSE